MSINLDQFKDLRIYFAYGSNMAPSSLKEKGLKLRFIGVGYLEHYKLMFNKISSKDSSVGFANIIPFWGKRVYGALYDTANEERGTTRFMDKSTDEQKAKAISTSIENLAILDKKEGYPNHYQRTCVGIRVDNRLVNAFTYIATTEKTANGNLLIGEEYISKINEGFDAYANGYFKDKEGLEYLQESKELMNIWKK